MSSPTTTVDVIALGQPTFGEQEIRAIEEVFRSGWVAGQGPTGQRFGEAFARTAGTRYALPVNNCTAALHLALSALGLQPGDEVIVADYTFPATGHSVVYGGGKPVFADVLPDTWTVDPKAVEAADHRADRRHHGRRHAGPARRLRRARGRSRPSAGSGSWRTPRAPSGATYRGRPAGSFGDAACFSFHGRKGITAGEGGALTADRERHRDERPARRTTSASRARCPGPAPPACRCPSSTRSATTTSSRTSRRRSCWPSSTGCRTW